MTQSRTLEEIRRWYDFEIGRRGTIETKAGVLVSANSLILTFVGVFATIHPIPRILVVLAALVAAVTGIIASAGASAIEIPFEQITETPADYTHDDDIVTLYSEKIESVRDDIRHRVTLFKWCYRATLVAIVLLALAVFGGTIGSLVPGSL